MHILNLFHAHQLSSFAEVHRCSETSAVWEEFERHETSLAVKKPTLTKDRPLVGGWCHDGNDPSCEREMIDTIFKFFRYFGGLYATSEL